MRSLPLFIPYPAPNWCFKAKGICFENDRISSRDFFLCLCPCVQSREISSNQTTVLLHEIACFGSVMFCASWIISSDVLPPDTSLCIREPMYNTSVHPSSSSSHFTAGNNPTKEKIYDDQALMHWQSPILSDRPGMSVDLFCSGLVRNYLNTRWKGWSPKLPYGARKEP